MDCKHIDDMNFNRVFDVVYEHTNDMGYKYADDKSPLSDIDPDQHHSINAKFDCRFTHGRQRTLVNRQKKDLV